MTALIRSYDFNGAKVRGIRLATVGAIAVRLLGTGCGAAALGALVACAKGLGFSDAEMRGALASARRADLRRSLLGLVAALDECPEEDVEYECAPSGHAATDSFLQHGLRIVADAGKSRLRNKAGRIVTRGTVYCVQANEGGPIKIGFSTDVDRRLFALNGSSPQPLRLLAHACSFDFVEKALHKRLAAHRLRCEWFADVPEVRAVADRLPAACLAEESLQLPKATQ